MRFILIIFAFTISFCIAQQTSILKPDNYKGTYILNKKYQKEFPSFNQFTVESKKKVNKFSDFKMFVVFWPDSVPVKGDSMRICWLKSYLFTKDSVMFNTGKFLESRYEFIGAFVESAFPEEGVVPLLQGELRYFKGKRLVRRGIVQINWQPGC